MSHFGVHMYPYNQEAALGNFNMPISNKPLTLYKGANTPLSFTIHNADGKYMVIGDNEHLLFSIFDRRLNKIIYETKLDKQLPTWVSESGQARPTFNNKTKVYYGCVVPQGVLQDLSTGTKYRWCIKKIKLDNSLIENSEYMYTGLNYEASADLVISSDASPFFVKSIEISEDIDGSWLPENNSNMLLPIEIGTHYRHGVFRSSPIAADAQVGLVDGLSTIALYLNNFVGRFQLQGYLGNDAPVDIEDYKWFIIKLDGKEFIESPFNPDDGSPIPLNGINAYNFKGNLMWIRVVALIPPEVVNTTPIIVRDVYEVTKTIPKILIRR